MVGCILLWIVVFPIYVFKRGKTPLKDAPRGALAPGASTVPPAQMYRECPHCKEAMRRDARICPHCRLESPAWMLKDDYWWVKTGDDEWYWLDEEAAQWRKPRQVTHADVAASANPVAAAGQGGDK